MNTLFHKFVNKLKSVLLVKICIISKEMGILGLSRLIADTAPESIREVALSSLFGRRIAIDASMSIYQFLIAIRNRDQLMTNDSGETTSHLIGLFYRTIKLLEVLILLLIFDLFNYIFYINNS